MNKKAFTLIELLAVIVILAIIALIAVPIVINIINDSKEESQKRSIELYLNSIKTAIVKANIDKKVFPSRCTIIKDNGNLRCKGLMDELIIEIKGEKPIEGAIKFNKENISQKGTWFRLPNGSVYVYKNNKLVKVPKLEEQDYIFESLDSGLYNEKYELIQTWEELLEKKYLTVTNGELTSGYVNANNHPNTEYIEGILVIDETVTTIGNNGLRALSKMTEVHFPKTLERIIHSGTGGSALAECTNLKNIFVDKNNQKYTSVNGVLFNKDMTSLLLYPNMNGTKYIIPNSVNTIGSNAFYGCNNLQEVKIPNSVTKLGSWSFYKCTGLKEIEIPSSIKTMEAYIFNGCTGIKNIILNEGITAIGVYAFPYTSITSLDIPESVTHIGNYAFANTSQLKEIKLPSGIKKIDYMAFGGTYTWNANRLEKVLYKGKEYLNTTELFESFTNNGVIFNNNCFNNSPFVD